MPAKERLMKRPEKILLGIGVVMLFVTIGISGDQSKTSIAAANASNKTSNHKPTVTTKTKTETQSIAYSSRTVEDVNLAKGTTKITTTGVNGRKAVTYKITYKNGKQTSKKAIRTKIITKPVTQVTASGVQPPPPPPCDPNYSGACVPNVYPSDVDCAGGSGNGPYYVKGPVRVVGSDVYGLDRDGNKVGCE